MAGLTSSRIPWLQAVGGVRWDCISGCDNPPSVCAVKSTPEGCWAERAAQTTACDDCMMRRDSWTCEVGHLGQSLTSCSLWAECFAPTFHSELLSAPLRTRRPYMIGVGLGGDLWSPGVAPNWRRQVLDVEEQCNRNGKRHIFVHLTKNPYSGDLTDFNLDSQWVGVSCTDSRAYALVNELDEVLGPKVHRWVSFEPVLSSLSSLDGWNMTTKWLADWLCVFGVEFVVLGGLSDGVGHILSPKEMGGLQMEWAQTIITAACNAECKVFCKNLSVDVWTNLVNPRTGSLMASSRELRELPKQWLATRRCMSNQPLPTCETLGGKHEWTMDADSEAAPTGYMA